MQNPKAKEERPISGREQAERRVAGATTRTSEDRVALYRGWADEARTKGDRFPDNSPVAATRERLAELERKLPQLPVRLIH